MEAGAGITHHQDADDDDGKDMSSSAPLSKSKKKPAVKYHLKVGKQQIQYKQNQPSQAHLPRNSALQYVSFFGKCYHCKYSAHSQKYCPLRQCQQCKEYGHSESVCWKLKPPQTARVWSGRTTRVSSRQYGK